MIQLWNFKLSYSYFELVQNVQADKAAKQKSDLVWLDDGGAYQHLSAPKMYGSIAYQLLTMSSFTTLIIISLNSFLETGVAILCILYMLVKPHRKYGHFKKE